MSGDELAKRHNVNHMGLSPESSRRPTLVLAHGFGSDQQIWMPVARILTEEAALVAERKREEIEHLEFSYGNVTLSFGVSEVLHGDTKGDLYPEPSQ